MPWNPAYDQWTDVREDTFRSEQLGWLQLQRLPALVETDFSATSVPDHQAYANEQCGPAEWELGLSTAHEYVMAEGRSAGTALMTPPSGATMRIGYVLADTSVCSLVQEVQEIESLLYVFRLEDDDIIPPQTRGPNHASPPCNAAF